MCSSYIINVQNRLKIVIHNSVFYELPKIVVLRNYLRISLQKVDRIRAVAMYRGKMNTVIYNSVSITSTAPIFLI